MPSLSPRHVLLTTDFSDNAATALPYARALARHGEARLTLVHVVQEHVEHLGDQVVSPAMDKELLRARNEARARLEDIVLEGVDPERVARVVKCAGSATAGILDAAREAGADWIVLATHGRGMLGRVILGSVASQVMSQAPCPVLCVKMHETGMLDARGELRIGSILVAGGMGDETCTAFDAALRWGEELGATVHYMDLTHPSMTPIFYPEGLITVVETGKSRLAAEKRRQQFLKEALRHKVEAVHANADVVHGNDIPRYARAHDIDVVVVQRATWGNAVAGSDASLRNLVHDVHSPLLVL